MGLNLNPLVNPPFLRPPTQPVVNGRYVGIALLVVAAGGGVEALTDLVGTNGYQPGLGWLGSIGQLTQLGSAAACVFGGWLMSTGHPSGKAPAIYGLATALVGQVVVLIAGSSLVDAAIVIILIVFAYYMVVISQFPVAAGAPAQTVVAIVIALVFVGALDWGLTSIQSSSTSSVGSTSSSAPGSAGVVTLTGENRITVMKLHNDVGTPCGPPPFKGAPPFNLFYSDNKKNVRLTVRVDSGSGRPFNVVADERATGAHADLTASGYKENATSGTVDLMPNKSGTFVFHFPPPLSNTTPTAPFVTGLQLTVTGTFSCG